MPHQNLETFCPSSKAEWRLWLEENHQTKSSIWLIYYRASTKIPSLTWSDAVDVALCFGWIDSTKKSIDEERYMQYFSQRKAKSSWSKINKDKVAVLIQNKEMTEAGHRSIARAKEDGSWQMADMVEALLVPQDLKAALATSDKASKFYDSLTKSSKKSLLYWLASAKRSATRQKRLLVIMSSASEGLLPPQFR